MSKGLARRKFSKEFKREAVKLSEREDGRGESRRSARALSGSVQTGFVAAMMRTRGRGFQPEWVRERILAPASPFGQRADRLGCCYDVDTRERILAMIGARSLSSLRFVKGLAPDRSVLEKGKARAGAIELIGQTITKHPDGLKVMPVEMLPNIVGQFARSIEGMKLGEVTVIDGGQGQAISGAAMGRARVLSESLAMLESVLGVDLR